MEKLKAIEIEISNDWGWCLLDILYCVSMYVKIWKIDEGEAYKNVDGKIVDLFDDSIYCNEDFFNVIREKHYVIQLSLWAINDKDDAIIFMRITDSSYVDIYIYDDMVYEKMEKEIGLRCFNSGKKN